MSKAGTIKFGFHFLTTDEFDKYELSLQQVVTNFLEICGSELILGFVGVSVCDHMTVAEQRDEESLALPRPEGVSRIEIVSNIRL